MKRDSEFGEAMEPLLLSAGAGLVDCQRLEYGLGLVLLYLQRLGVRGVSPDQTRAVLDGRKELTAGQLARLLAERVPVEPNLIAVMADGLEARNRLIHGFLLRNFDRAVDPRTREDVLTELRALRFRVQAAEQAIRPHACRLLERLDGLTAEQMWELALGVFHEREQKT
jgi:hypothetical protein